MQLVINYLIIAGLSVAGGALILFAIDRLARRSVNRSY